MASEDADSDLGVLDDLLHDVAVAEAADGVEATADTLVIEAVDTTELSADAILQQLDSVTRLETEDVSSATTVAEQAQTIDITAEGLLEEDSPALELGSDSVVVDQEPPQPLVSEDLLPTPLDAEEEAFHEAKTFADESTDAAAESDELPANTDDGRPEPVDSTEATATTLAQETIQHNDEENDDIDSVPSDSDVFTESPELLRSDPVESPSLTVATENETVAADNAVSLRQERVPSERDDEKEVGEVQEAVVQELGPHQAEEAPAQSRDHSSSSDGSWENVVAPPPPLTPLVTDENDFTDVQPPPAPQPLFSGSLNPTGDLMSAEAGGNEGDSDSDDSDQGDEGEGEQTELPPPPLQLTSACDDEDEELEVDPVVAEEIRSSKTSIPQLQGTNALLNALQQAEGISKQLTADVMQAHASKMDEIALSFDAEQSQEVRAAQVVATEAHPESSVTTFGIGYQSMRKRGDNGEVERDTAYTVAKGPMFHELESEVTLTGDVSLSLAQSQENRPDIATDDDEFGEILLSVDGPASPTRVNAILQKTMASRSHDEDEQRLLSELKKATQEEKLRLNEPETDSKTPTGTAGKKAVEDNALTLKELHSIYKRGLGDQEVLLMNDDDNVDTKQVSVSTTEQSPAPELSVMGRLLSNHGIAEEAEEDEDEEEEEENGDDSRGGANVAAERSSLDEDDADAVTVESDQMILVGGSDFASELRPSTKRPPAEDAEDEWREIQLLRQASASSPQAKTTAEPAGTATPDSGTCSKISYAEALSYFLESDDVLEHLDHIVAEEKAPSTSCFGCLTRPRLSFPDAINQRDRFFCVAASAFDPRNTVHVRMLQTIYRQIVSPHGTHRDVPLMGVHWESIGFQGSDPSTDLRGCGVLSLLQLLHLVETHAELARSFHSLSQHAVRHFPMACASINITLQCLVTLRSGALYRECNKRTSVFAAANALHVALTSQLMKELQTSGDDIPIVMKRVLDHGRLHPDKALELHTAAAPSAASKPALQRQESQSPGQASPRKASLTGRGGRASSSHAAAEFTEIGLHSVDDE